MKVKKYVTNKTHQTEIHGYTLSDDGMSEITYTLRGSVKSTQLAVNKIRSTIDPTFTTIDNPTITEVVTGVPIEVFNSIAIEVNELDSISVSDFASKAIEKLNYLISSD